MSEPFRDVVFICHATPDDNDFVRWLGARLIGLGYHVWADVFKLKGGTPFWKNIEEAIRTRAAKVIYVASVASVNPDRKGVRDELAAAASMAKKLNDPEYIIPIRLDKVDFGDFPISLLQLNALDFSSGWGGMLPSLIETLENANVPVDSSKADERMAFWKDGTTREAPVVEVGTERLLTNLLPVTSLPKQISFYDFSGPSTEIKPTLDKTGIPYVQFLRLIISFADVAEFQSQMPPHFALSLNKRIDVDKFLLGPTGMETAPEWRDARNILSNLLRQHVERFLISKGLKLFESPRGNVFYFPIDLLPDSKVRYVTPDGKRTWKSVIGRSEKYRVNWHLSMMVNIDLGPPGFVRFKPYICFSEDGVRLVTDPARMSAIRRRICKTWWNRQWRQLQQAFISFLSDDASEIIVGLDGPELLVLEGMLLHLQGVRRLIGDIELDDFPEEPEELVDDDLDDELDLSSVEDEDDAA